MFFIKKPQAAATADQSMTVDGAQQPKQDLEKAPTNRDGALNYPKGLRLVLCMFSVFVCVFLVSLDRVIVATAIPAITDEFGSVMDIGWYASAFMLTTCAFQLLFGKLYTAFSIKHVWLVSVLIFEVGSAVSGAAPDSVALIVGRAIAGVGGAGTLSGAVVVVAWIFPLHKRAMYQGLLSAVTGVSSVAGPLLGGVFTTEVSWRWCFYINIPIGAVAALLIVFLLDIEDSTTAKEPIKRRLSQLDFYGTALIVPGSICLILAFQWGGSRYEWSDGNVIALLIMSCVLICGFVLVQVFLPNTATLPPHIFMQRSILAGAFSSFCNGAQLIIFMYYLPIWFQAIRGYTAVGSGIQTLSILLPMVGASIVAGIVVKKVGYYTPGLIIGVCFSSVGAGLLTTLETDTSKAKWVGYQILLGLGMGFTNQPPKLAAQTVLPQHEIAIGTSVMFFFQFLGGAIFASVGQNVLNSQLAKYLSNLPGFDAATLQRSGATFMTGLPESITARILTGYNQSLQTVFLVGLIVTCSSMLGALAMEWKSMNEEPQQPASAAEDS